jgi:hypothetical protein
MKSRDDIWALIVRWGFGALIAIAVGVALMAGATVAIPADIPGVALQAVPVYR